MCHFEKNKYLKNKVFFAILFETMQESFNQICKFYSTFLLPGILYS